ncbi:MAG: hypothetical protein K2Y21_05930 [Phycisphaerales bacterium]|nr:hypothetical protein [Phycisphaerales bacterium]
MPHPFRLAIAALAAMLATIAFAGPLNPPAGPVAPTAKPLAEIEPRIAINAINTPGDANSFYRITQPGSYYLAANVSVGTIEHGIQIDLNTDGLVTIDLNGFSVTGAEGTLNGIDVDGPFKPRVVLRNGFVMSFGGNGVDLVGAESVTIEKVETARNSGKGFVIDTGSIADCKAQFNSGGGFQTGVNSQISNCLALTTGPVGIKTGNHSILVDCTAKGTTDTGIECGSFCVLNRCTAESCGGYGISAGSSASLTDCTATSNAAAGIGTNAGSTLIGCTAANNTKWGFSGASFSVYQNCTASNNGFTGFIASASQMSECVANGNSLEGFVLSGLSNSISKCTATSNRGNGIVSTGGTLIVDCVSSFNFKHGIYVTFQGNTIRGNSCSGNGQGTDPGAGICTEDLANRIEDNICKDNDYGIRVLGSRTTIVRNSCFGNTTTNWSIAANNSYGPIIDRSAAAAPAVNGNAAAAALGSTDPNANFTN